MLAMGARSPGNANIMQRLIDAVMLTVAEGSVQEETFQPLPMAVRHIRCCLLPRQDVPQEPPVARVSQLQRHEELRACLCPRCPPVAPQRKGVSHAGERRTAPRLHWRETRSFAGTQVRHAIFFHALPLESGGSACAIARTYACR